MDDDEAKLVSAGAISPSVTDCLQWNSPGTAKMKATEALRRDWAILD